MNKEKIIVPKGVRYISDWSEYNLANYDRPHILNKVLTGCGFTEYCIRNQQNLILVSPRKFLLENKEDQHPGEVYYARNEYFKGVDYELDISAEFNKDKVQKGVTDEEIKMSVWKMKEGIKDYCRSKGFGPKKILVTYDSFRHVKDALQEIGLFDYFQIVVDEFQSIFIDSRFKSDTELELLGHLRDIQRLCFVSATPMLDKYLDMLDEFKDLPYLELDWETEDPTRIIHPKLDIKFTYRSLNEEASNVVERYQKGKYEQHLSSKTGGIVESREATLFMNSVKGICQVIRSNMLHTDQCNILCARTKENEKAVRTAFNDVLKKENKDNPKPPKIPKDYEVIGRIPKRGEPHKQFTFCTRTVYLGADFYSTNSRTFIFSDSNIDCLSVDISMDLEQILGRQRLIENPWKNTANLYVKLTKDSNIKSADEFKEYLNNKIEKTNRLLKNYEDESNLATKHDLAENYDFVAKHNYYKMNYVAVNHHEGSDMIPVFNNLVLVSEIRTFEVQQIDYKDRFSVFSTIQEEGINSIEDKIYDYVYEFGEITNTVDRLKYIVRFTTETPGITKENINSFFSLIPDKYGEYYYLLGPDRIKANNYRETNLRREWLKIHSEVKVEDTMITQIYDTFKISEKYSKASIKSTLKEIYERFDFSKTAKASDLTEYFVLKTIKLLESGKWVNGFEILGKR